MIASGAGGESAANNFSRRCLISIITATYNASEQLIYTLKSLRNQTFVDFEWIVVDGGSTDGTVELLQENEDLISWWISESDRGIYDAWNKACPKARGEWLLFLGAGDEFENAETLQRCADELAGLPETVQLAYGRLHLISEQGRVDLESFGAPWATICDRWEIGRPALPPHGATFQRRSLFVGATPFDLKFRIAADSQFLLRHLVSPQATEPAFMPLTITRSPIGGLSFRLQSTKEIHREIAAINHELGLCPPLSHRVFEICRRAVAAALCLLPAGSSAWIADVLRRIVGKPRRWSVR